MCLNTPSDAAPVACLVGDAASGALWLVGAISAPVYLHCWSIKRWASALVYADRIWKTSVPGWLRLWGFSLVVIQWVTALDCSRYTLHATLDNRHFFCSLISRVTAHTVARNIEWLRLAVFTLIYNSPIAFCCLGVGCHENMGCGKLSIFCTDYLLSSSEVYWLANVYLCALCSQRSCVCVQIKRHRLFFSVITSTTDYLRRSSARRYPRQRWIRILKRNYLHYDCFCDKFYVQKLRRYETQD